MRARLAALTAAVILPVAVLTACSDSDSNNDAPPVLASGKLVVGTNAQFAPMVFSGDQNQLAGSDVDMMNATGEQLGVQVEFQQAPFPDLLPGVVGTEYNAAVRGIFDTLRRTHLYVTGPKYVIAFGYVGLMGALLYFAYKMVLWSFASIL